MRSKAVNIAARIRTRANAARATASATAGRASARAARGAARAQRLGRRGWAASAPARKPLAYLYNAAVHDKIPTRYRIAIALAALLLAGAVSRAEADTLHVRHVHYNAGSGTVQATVTAVGPQDTAIAIGLTHGRCPTRPAESEVRLGVTAEGHPHVLLANGGASAALWRHHEPKGRADATPQLCVWTIHEGGAIGAHYEERAPRHPQTKSTPQLEGPSEPQAGSAPA